MRSFSNSDVGVKKSESDLRRLERQRGYQQRVKAKKWNKPLLRLLRFGTDNGISNISIKFSVLYLEDCGIVIPE